MRKMMCVQAFFVIDLLSIEQPKMLLIPPTRTYAQPTNQQSAYPTLSPFIHIHTYIL